MRAKRTAISVCRTGARGAVVRSLEYAGVPADRLSAVGFGAERPVADNGTAKGMARNRRIEFRAYTD